MARRARSTAPAPGLHRGPLVLVALAVLLLATGPARSADTLTARIELALVGADLGGAKVAVSVVEAGPGTTLVDLRANDLMIPASNLKLLTTGAALVTLGGDFRFQTKLLRRGNELVVVGDGDPAFGDPELLRLMPQSDAPNAPVMDVESFLRLWIDPIVASGAKRIEGVVVDDRVFDREFVHSTWPRDQLNRRYCAQVSGLSFHLNQVYTYPAPRPSGRPRIAVLEPASSLLQIKNSATSRQGVHDSNTVWIARKLGTNILTFYGNVKHAYRVPVAVTIHDMPTFFGALLAERLRQKGIDVGPHRLCRPNDPPSDGETVAPVIFTPISTVVTRCNRDSQNLYAEALIKRIGFAKTGQPGSWLNGAAIVRHVVYERLRDASRASRISIADGSGLSRRNLVAPATLTAWLNTFHNDEALGEIFIESLAVGGESGTLRKRLGSFEVEGAIVQAKSGYINGVSCLSGYVTASDGRRRCFSVMVNDLKVPVRRAKGFQNKVVQLVAASMAEAPAQLGSD